MLCHLDEMDGDIVGLSGRVLVCTTIRQPWLDRQSSQRCRWGGVTLSGLLGMT